MINGQVRRSQLIAPFGPGSMQVLSDGTSVITAGLDYWFESMGDKQIDRDEFRVDEWRLEQLLGVEALYMPPDYRRRSQFGSIRQNTHLTVPVLRFPAWSFCRQCKSLSPHPLHEMKRPRCKQCEKAGKPWPPYLSQVPFVALCENGHLQDFPWIQWVHSAIVPQCLSPQLTLRSSGGGTLGSQRVKCSTCERERSLENITSVERSQDGEETTYLSTRLENGAEYACRGAAPWLGQPEATTPCGAPLRGSLRGASNVYYALVKSSIYIPERTVAGIDPSLLAVLEERSIETARSYVRELSDRASAEKLRRAARGNAWRLEQYTDEQIDAALSLIEGVRDGGVGIGPQDPSDQAPFRRQEYDLLRDVLESPELVVREAADPYCDAFALVVGRVRLVERLRETRVLWGFNRIYAESKMDIADRSALLRRKLVGQGHSWLPAQVVLGEGIYLELDQERLAQWEVREDVLNRLRPMLRSSHGAAERRGLQKRDISPRFVVLHTLAHLLINQLTYECGYSSASLRERLYASPGPGGMAGLLIYTAAGDSEGTLGGLVRMGDPGRLEGVFENALGSARWCSSDPVCIESRGQGPDSCNLAACHSCALLPETACEEFNRFLDRGMVTGTLDRPNLGFLEAPASG